MWPFSSTSTSSSLLQVATSPLVGIWVAGVPAVSHALVLSAALAFYASTQHADRVLTSDGSFLVLGFLPGCRGQAQAFECCAASPRGIPLMPYHLSLTLPETPPATTVADATPRSAHSDGSSTRSARSGVRRMAMVESPHLLYNLYVSRHHQASAGLPAHASPVPASPSAAPHQPWQSSSTVATRAPEHLQPPALNTARSAASQASRRESDASTAVSSDMAALHARAAQRGDASDLASSNPWEDAASARRRLEACTAAAQTRPLCQSAAAASVSPGPDTSTAAPPAPALHTAAQQTSACDQARAAQVPVVNGRQSVARNRACMLAWQQELSSRSPPVPLQQQWQQQQEQEHTGRTSERSQVAAGTSSVQCADQTAALRSDGVSSAAGPLPNRLHATQTTVRQQSEAHSDVGDVSPSPRPRTALPPTPTPTTSTAVHNPGPTPVQQPHHSVRGVHATSSTTSAPASQAHAAEQSGPARAPAQAAGSADAAQESPYRALPDADAPALPDARVPASTQTSASGAVSVSPDMVPASHRPPSLAAGKADMQAGAANCPASASASAADMPSWLASAVARYPDLHALLAEQQAVSGAVHAACQAAETHDRAIDAAACLRQSQQSLFKHDVSNGQHNGAASLRSSAAEHAAFAAASAAHRVLHTADAAPAAASGRRTRAQLAAIAGSPVSQSQQVALPSDVQSAASHHQALQERALASADAAAALMPLHAYIVSLQTEVGNLRSQVQSLQSSDASVQKAHHGVQCSLQLQDGQADFAAHAAGVANQKAGGESRDRHAHQNQQQAQQQDTMRAAERAPLSPRSLNVQADAPHAQAATRNQVADTAAMLAESQAAIATLQRALHAGSSASTASMQQSAQAAAIAAVQAAAAKCAAVLRSPAGQARQPHLARHDLQTSDVSPVRAARAAGVQSNANVSAAVVPTGTAAQLASQAGAGNASDQAEVSHKHVVDGFEVSASSSQEWRRARASPHASPEQPSPSPAALPVSPNRPASVAGRTAATQQAAQHSGTEAVSGEAASDGTSVPERLVNSEERASGASPPCLSPELVALVESASADALRDGPSHDESVQGSAAVVTGSLPHGHEATDVHSRTQAESAGRASAARTSHGGASEAERQMTPAMRRLFDTDDAMDKYLLSRYTSRAHGSVTAPPRANARNHSGQGSLSPAVLAQQPGKNAVASTPSGGPSASPPDAVQRLVSSAGAIERSSAPGAAASPLYERPAMCAAAAALRLLDMEADDDSDELQRALEAKYGVTEQMLADASCLVSRQSLPRRSRR